MSDFASIDNLTVSTIRMLAADAIEKANSGHPGMAIGAAPMAYALYARHMMFNPKNPNWPGRDRFILSAGHGSALQYALLHIFGYDISLDDLKAFRALDSRAPGHPEYPFTPGVEATTGALGQGIANAVGLAWAQSHMAAVFNRPDYPIFDNYTYALCGDGCMQEGISAEACSLAGTLGLGKLILLYDSNDIQIEGPTKHVFTEDVLKRYESYGWHTQYVKDGNDLQAISRAISAAKDETERPSLIEIKTIIGYGAPNKQGTEKSHGEPLGADELKATKKFYGFDPEERFYVPKEAHAHAPEYISLGAAREAAWDELMAGYAAAYPAEYAQLQSRLAGKFPDLREFKDLFEISQVEATRTSSQRVLNRLASLMPDLFGGAADLGPSTKTIMAGRESYSRINPRGTNLHFGVREHAMHAIANGLALYGGLRPYVAGFFIFSDYSKAAKRMSALMGLPVINIFTHDSIGVGEDGPTHQPIEQLAALRGIPNFTVIRPCDAREVVAAWISALESKNSPTAIVLTRQNVQQVEGTSLEALKGAYVLRESKKSTPDVILIASGSEVALSCAAHERLAARGVDARVVSMPSWEIFEAQPDEYKEMVLPKNVRARLAVEAASPFGWERYTGLDGEIIAMYSFGKSAPGDVLFKEFGFTVENVVAKALDLATVGFGSEAPVCQIPLVYKSK